MKRLRILAGMALVLSTVPTGSCDDDEWVCWDACVDLADCENDWLVADGKEPMTTAEYDIYVDDCEADCWDANSDEEDIKCILEASCDELRDGECRN